MRALLVVGALLLSAPVAAQEPRTDVVAVPASCLAEDTFSAYVKARQALPVPMGLNLFGVPWTAYVDGRGAWMMTFPAEGMVCIVTAGHPGTWLSVLPE